MRDNSGREVRLAPEGDQELGATLVAAHASEPVLEDAAIEELVDRAACRSAQAAVARLEALLVRIDESVEVLVHEPVER